MPDEFQRVNEQTSPLSASLQHISAVDNNIDVSQTSTLQVLSDKIQEGQIKKQEKEESEAERLKRLRAREIGEYSIEELEFLYRMHN